MSKNLEGLETSPRLSEDNDFLLKEDLITCVCNQYFENGERYNLEVYTYYVLKCMWGKFYW